MATKIQAFNPADALYEQRFRQFLAHTKQKKTTSSWLEQLFPRLGNRRQCVDVGAGTGAVLKRFELWFERCIAIEPDHRRIESLRANCPAAEVYATSIEETIGISGVDFLHCAHVFYYIPRSNWHKNLLTCLGWLAAGGVAVFILKNRSADFQEIISHFFGAEHTYDLARICGEVAKDSGFMCNVTPVKAVVKTDEVEVAVDITEFMLNDVDLKQPSLSEKRPTRIAVAELLRERYRQDQTFTMSCNQDVIVMQRQP